MQNYDLKYTQTIQKQKSLNDGVNYIYFTIYRFHIKQNHNRKKYYENH